MKELGYIIAAIGAICEWSSGFAPWAHMIWMIGACMIFMAPKAAPGQSGAPETSKTPAPPSTPKAPFEMPPKGTAAKFFIYLGKAVKGPYSADQLQALIETGTASSDTQVCREGSQDWKPLSQFSF